MSDGRQAPGAEETPGGSPTAPTTYHKSLNLRRARAEAIVVEMPQWERLQRRVEALEALWSINWLTAGASGCLTTGLGALIAALSIPTGEQTGISPTVRPALFIAAGCSALMAVALVALYFRVKGDREKTGADIVDEMTTYERSFELKQAERDVEELSGSA